MFARVVTFQFRYDLALEKQMMQIEQENMPVLQEQKGFIKLYQLLDRANGKGAQIHFWESEADLLAYLNGPTSQALHSRIQAATKDFTLAPAKSGNYEVVGES
jgi:hypothetical protein